MQPLFTRAYSKDFFPATNPLKYEKRSICQSYVLGHR